VVPEDLIVLGGCVASVNGPDRGRKTHVKRSPDTHERDIPTGQDEHPKNADAQEKEIDQILADSFPASDAPPWTLGVTSSRAEERPKT
jgi:hypothetical protein